jgi:hypothetical protein
VRPQRHRDQLENGGQYHADGKVDGVVVTLAME